MSKKSITFVVIAYLFSWLAWGIPILTMNGKFELDQSFFPFLVIGSFGPTISAILTTYIFDGKGSLKNLFKKYVAFKFPFKNYIASLFPFALLVVAIYFSFGIQSFDINKNILLYVTVLLAPLNGLLSALFSGVGPLGEELGWRGFLLPELLKNKSDFKASLILGIIWAFWHLPIFLFSSFRNGLDLPLFLILYPISIILIAYSMTKIWHWTKGSVFIAIWAHGIINFILENISDRKFWNLEKFNATNLYLLILSILFAFCVINHFIDKNIKVRI